MNTVKLTFALLLCVVVLACVAPILVKSTTTGNVDGVLQDISTSIEQTNDALENSSLGAWVAEMDATTN